MKEIKTYMLTALLSIFLTAIASFCFVSGRYVLHSEFSNYKIHEREVDAEKWNMVYTLLAEGKEFQTEYKAIQAEMQKDINEIKIILARKVNAGEIVNSHLAKEGGNYERALQGMLQPDRRP